ncbi:MAG: SAM-dependent methyltransferase [Chloroflexi bacterium]|nr:SAM-dependent methyltransferase [Chloroflexota bacterium]
MASKNHDLERELQSLLAREGRVTFAQFMEVALYWPGAGYYTSGRSPAGPEGDYYTSPSVHPAFGALLALQMEEMWQRLARPHRFWAVELGAGPGRLAQDITGFSRHLDPQFAAALRYVCVDRGGGGGPGGLRALRATGIPFRNLIGCILSNELLDAFPVHRVRRQGRRLLESFISLSEGKLTELWAEPSTPALAEYLAALGISLPEGCLAEVRPALAPWIRKVGQALSRGFVLTIDYGGLAPELYGAHQPQGTLLCHYRHTVHQDPLAHLGEQDITAPVDFTTLVMAGEEVGLEPLGLVSQGRFLENLGLREYREALARRGLPSAEHHANQMALLDLARPEGMGNFRVLVQGKGVATEPLLGLIPSPSHWRRLRELPLPQLEPERAFLLRGRYPHLAQEIDPQPPSEMPVAPRKGD